MAGFKSVPWSPAGPGVNPITGVYQPGSASPGYGQSHLNPGQMNPYGRPSSSGGPTFNPGGFGNPSAQSGGQAYAAPREITGGGVPLEIEPAMAVAIPAVPEFLGLNQAVAPDFIAPREFSDVVNFEGGTLRGSLRKRRGFQKFSAHPAANTDGVSVYPAQFVDGNGKAVLVVTTFNGSNTETIEAVSVTLDLRGHEKPPAAPSVVFSQSGSNIQGVVAVSEVGGLEKAFIAISQSGFPTSPWGVAGTLGTVSSIAYNGYSTATPAVAHSGSSGNVFFCAAWVATRFGLSKPAYGKVTIA